MWSLFAATLLLITLSVPQARADETAAAKILQEDLQVVNAEAAADLATVAEDLRQLKSLPIAEEVQSDVDQAAMDAALQEIGDRTFETDNSIEDINADSGVSEALFEADLLLTKDQAEELLAQRNGSRTKRSAPMADKRYLWDKTKPIPFQLHDSLCKARSAIYAAIKYWQDTTCVRFAEHASGPNKLIFMHGNGCYSNLGRIFSQPTQEVSIGSRCETVGIAAHEIGHALGFHHTHVRHDRDRYVMINRNNVKSDMYSANFAIESVSKNENYGMPYEYGSVMHYSGYGFAINRNQPTIVSRDANYEDSMGNRRPPSFNDIAMMNTHYSCQDKCRGQPMPSCQNGGVQDVNNCGVCRCPGGFSGPTCSQRPTSCGKTVTATQEWQYIEGKVSVGTNEPQMNFAECVWWIENNANRNVEIKIDGLYGMCGKGCGAGGVEVKAEANKKLTGYTFCCSESSGKTFRATGTVIPVIGFNNAAFSQFRVGYKLA